MLSTSTGAPALHAKQPHGAIASQSASSSNRCAAAANTGAAADAEEAVHRQDFRKDVQK